MAWVALPAVLQWLPLVRKYVEGSSIPPEFVLATIEMESGGKPQAYRFEPGFYQKYLVNNETWQRMMKKHSWKPEDVSASYGLMQLMYTTAVGIGFGGQPQDLFNPEVSIKWGTTLIKRHMLKYNDLSMVACAYNGGGGSVKNLIEGVDCRPVRYSKKVINMTKFYKMHIKQNKL